MMECLHTFCRTCLIKYFRDEEVGCPTCGFKINTVRPRFHRAALLALVLICGAQLQPWTFVRPDRTLEEIIRKIVPGAKDFPQCGRKPTVSGGSIAEPTLRPSQGSVQGTGVSTVAGVDLVRLSVPVCVCVRACVCLCVSVSLCLCLRLSLSLSLSLSFSLSLV
jgi:hypothetical protein